MFFGQAAATRQALRSESSGQRMLSRRQPTPGRAFALAVRGSSAAALHRIPSARARLLQAIRANIVDIAATTGSNWNSLFQFACKNGIVKSILSDS